MTGTTTAGAVSITNAITVQAGATAPGAPVIVLVSSLTNAVTLSIVPPEGYEAIDIYRDGTILPAGTDIPNPVLFTDSTVSEGVEYVYTAKARNATGTSPASNAITTTTPTGLQATDDKLERIEAAISSLIAGIRKTAGYYFDWGSSNIVDMAQKTFPCADVSLITDEGVVDINTANAWTYTIESRFKISVQYKNEVLSDSPQHAINKYQYRCIHDLKKLFGINYTLNGTVNGCEYNSTVREDLNTGNVAIPSTLVTEITVYYNQDRRYPTQDAN